MWKAVGSPKKLRRLLESIDNSHLERWRWSTWCREGPDRGWPAKLPATVCGNTSSKIDYVQSIKSSLVMIIFIIVIVKVIIIMLMLIILIMRIIIIKLAILRYSNCMATSLFVVICFCLSRLRIIRLSKKAFSCYVICLYN